MNFRDSLLLSLIQMTHLQIKLLTPKSEGEPQKLREEADKIMSDVMDFAKEKEEFETKQQGQEELLSGLEREEKPSFKKRLWK